MIHWRKSSHSQGGGQGECVELADLETSIVGVRDSKNPTSGHLHLTRRELATLVGRIKDGAFG